MTATEALVAQQVDAYNAQDMDAFLATFHPDVEFIGWPDHPHAVGHDDFRSLYGALWASAPALEALILDRIAVGRFVIDREQLVNHPEGPREPLVVIYEVAEGLIRRFWSITEGT